MTIVSWLKTFPVIETLATVVLILVALRRHQPKAARPHQVHLRWFKLLLRRPWLAYLAIGVLAFTACALLAVFAGIPHPFIQDEYSYLLQGDTFALGRLTNPPHPLWRHFETFHVIQHPTYASKFPPAQGLFLAVGQVISGHPIVGVWLSMAFACAAVTWMLAGWLPLRWALVGGLVAVIRLVFSGPYDPVYFAYWSQSYWGGAVAALGGALVFGALPRIMKTQRWPDALWLALGLAILANSRPFEGLVVSLPVAVTLAVWLIKSPGVSRRLRFRRILLPATLVLMVTVLGMGFYNFRVTGDPCRLPHQVHESTYAIVPVFLWQPLKPEPPYRHAILQKFYRGYVSSYLNRRSLQGWVKETFDRLKRFWLFFFGIIFIPPLLLLARSRKAWQRRNVLFPLGIMALIVAALLTETWFIPHYAAPIACLAILLMVESLRQARRFTWRGKPVGKNFGGGGLPVLLVSALASFVLFHYLQPPSPWQLDRERILRELAAGPERHLVVVRYSANHNLHNEWVYNGADIDGAKVVWAREMTPQADRELLNYFKDRRVWLLKADQLPRRLLPYPGLPPG